MRKPDTHPMECREKIFNDLSKGGKEREVEKDRQTVRESQEVKMFYTLDCHVLRTWLAACRCRRFVILIFSLKLLLLS